MCINRRKIRQMIKEGLNEMSGQGIHLGDIMEFTNQDLTLVEFLQMKGL